VEENIIGIENKRQLARLHTPVLNSAAFESFVQNPKSLCCSGLQRSRNCKHGCGALVCRRARRRKSPARWETAGADVGGAQSCSENLYAKEPEPVRSGPLIKTDPCRRVLLRKGVAGRARDVILSVWRRPIMTAISGNITMSKRNSD